MLKSSAFPTYAVHVAQSCEGSSCHLLDAVLVDPHLNQRGRQVLGDSGQQILGEVQLLHALQRHKCPGVDFGNKVIPERQTLKKKEIQYTLYLICVRTLARRQTENEKRKLK